MASERASQQAFFGVSALLLAATAASFVGMWVVMMLAMMLPSLVPMLWRYRRAVGRPGEARLGRLTALVGVGYFFVWTVFGMAAFTLGVGASCVEDGFHRLANSPHSFAGPP